MAEKIDSAATLTAYRVSATTRNFLFSLRQFIAVIPMTLVLPVPGGPSLMLILSDNVSPVAALWDNACSCKEWSGYH